MATTAAALTSSVGTTRPMALCGGLIGPSVWRSNTLKEINLSEGVIRRSDQSNELGRTVDCLPHLRGILAELSNDEAHRYGRQVRLVVYRLRESIIDTNEEMKMLNRIRERLERAHEHIRKDLVVNYQSQQIRKTRPDRERCKDGADDLLDAERLTLLNLKRMLEEHLKLVKEQLQVLEAARRRLTNVERERSRVLDLVCAAIPGVGSQSAYINLYNIGPNRRCSSSASRIKGACSGDLIFRPDNLGPYTPECETALEDARTARARSEMLRYDAVLLIEKVEKIQREAHEAVNQGLYHKVAETINLKHHLELASGENQHATNRAQRWYDVTEHAWWQTRGPESTHDLMTHEKLDRPIMTNLQKHPGQNMPEAQEIVRGGDGLQESLHMTGRNISLLKLAHAKLVADIADKDTGAEVDDSVIKLRRRKANHRWVIKSKPFY